MQPRLIFLLRTGWTPPPLTAAASTHLPPWRAGLFFDSTTSLFLFSVFCFIITRRQANQNSSTSSSSSSLSAVRARVFHPWPSRSQSHGYLPKISPATPLPSFRTNLLPFEFSVFMGTRELEPEELFSNRNHRSLSVEIFQLITVSMALMGDWSMTVAAEKTVILEARMGNSSNGSGRLGRIYAGTGAALLSL